jgi:hypothetical protein
LTPAYDVLDKEAAYWIDTENNSIMGHHLYYRYATKRHYAKVFEFFPPLMAFQIQILWIGIFFWNQLHLRVSLGFLILQVPFLIGLPYIS